MKNLGIWIDIWHILGEDWVNVFFSFYIKQLPIQPQNFQEKKYYEFCSTPAGVGLLACCGHTLHLCIFFFKEKEMDTAITVAKHMVFWKLCRDEPA